MARKLTKKQKGFADDYVDTGNATKSALKNYDTEDYFTAGNIASDNLKKPKIIEYIEANADNAMSRIVEISIKAKNETVKLNANKDIVDRAGFKPTERQEVKITLPKPILDLTDAGIQEDNSNQENNSS